MLSAQGLLFLGKARPLATTAADGTFLLTLLAMDRIDVHQVEPWRITFGGAPAQDFWREHAQHLTPGQPLHVELERIRTFTTPRGAPESHAQVRQITLAPRRETAQAA